MIILEIISSKYDRKKEKLKFKAYKRGSIVLVNFNNGVGYELNGSHLCVVLNKKDSPNNGVLTVIPLSSKNKPYYLDLGNIVSNLIIPSIFKEYNSIKEQLEDLRLQRLVLEDSYTFKNLDNDIENDFINELIIESNKDINKLRLSMDVLKHNIEELQTVSKTYDNMNKGSYALIQNITTISKLRIMKPINKYDPISKIKLPNKLMDEIDKEIVRLFTKE